ncbi:MAG: heavy-metal-associated domain-containing protein [Planctomycetota bacterium]|nr:heavy-metal-associated domain-containing protein [Planctomycetaceae bacterium]MDQ3329607.1 heavy-metal-associated domain-containing protein [Planctomycetota bacterium]
MKFPVIGGIAFLFSGGVALAAVALLASADKPASASAGASIAEPETPTVEAPEGALVYSVPDMHCEFACAPKVRETLEGIVGVKKVETNVENQTVTVYTGAEFNAETALAALSEAGYPGKKVSK